MMGKAKKAVLLIAAAVWAAGILSGCAGGDYQPIEIPTETAGGEDIPNRVPQAETRRQRRLTRKQMTRFILPETGSISEVQAAPQARSWGGWTEELH